MSTCGTVSYTLLVILLFTGVGIFVGLFIGSGHATPDILSSPGASTIIHDGTTLTSAGLGAAIGAGAGAGLGAACAATTFTSDKKWTALFDMFFWTIMILGVGALIGSQTNNGADFALWLARFGMIAFCFNVCVVTVTAKPGWFSEVPTKKAVPDIIPDGENASLLGTPTADEPMSSNFWNSFRNLFLHTFKRCAWAPAKWIFCGNPLVQFIKYWMFEKKTDRFMRHLEHFEEVSPAAAERKRSRSKKGCDVSASTFLYIILYIASFVLATVVGNFLGGVWWPLIVTNVAFFGAYAIGSTGVSSITSLVFPAKDSQNQQPKDEHGVPLLLDVVEPGPVSTASDVSAAGAAPSSPALKRRRLPGASQQRILKRLSLTGLLRKPPSEQSTLPEIEL